MKSLEDQAGKKQSQKQTWIESCGYLPGGLQHNPQEVVQQGRNAAQLIMITKADKSKLEISLKDLASRHSSLKAKINFQLVCRTNKIKTGMPVALKMHFFSHNLMKWGEGHCPSSSVS